ncbi:MAG: hypothetical protein JSU03_10865 [Bacteroidetes bacterium]|nr:hypothetical protein [Bacteroidota bacterium]MBS1757770.1 hypothetical protein [Bacteroidota bacterium]
MKINFLLFIISAALLASCSTTYKSGQTPDDVYYSPTRSINESRHVQNNESAISNYEDRQIRMSAYDYRWRYLDDYYNYDYSYSPYRYGYDYGYYYNPYYYPCPVYISGVAISNPKNTTPRMINLKSYSNSNLSITNQKTFGTYQVNSRKAYSNSNTNSNTNSFIRKVINSAKTIHTYSSENNNSRSYENNTRSYSPSSNNSSSSGSSSGSISRPSRGRNN